MFVPNSIVDLKFYCWFKILSHNQSFSDRFIFVVKSVANLQNFIKLTINLSVVNCCISYSTSMHACIAGLIWPGWLVKLDYKLLRLHWSRVHQYACQAGYYPTWHHCGNWVGSCFCPGWDYDSLETIHLTEKADEINDDSLFGFFAKKKIIWVKHLSHQLNDVCLISYVLVSLDIIVSIINHIKKWLSTFSW